MNAHNTPNRLSHVWVALLGFALVVGLALPSIAMAADGQRARMSRELSQKLAKPDDGRQIPVIVTAPQDEVDRLERTHKMRVKRMASGAVFYGTSTEVNSLSSDPGVKFIEEDRPIYSTMAITPQATGADQVWRGESGSAFGGITGRRVGVAVLDSGVSSHGDLNNRLQVSYDFTDPRGGVREGGRDGYGHGTHVAGTIAGSGAGSRSAEGTPYIGMAPGVSLISMKVLSDDGSGYVSDVIEAIDYCIKYRYRLDIRVINLSLGHPASEAYRDDPLALAVERAVAAPGCDPHWTGTAHHRLRSSGQMATPSR